MHTFVEVQEAQLATEAAMSDSMICATDAPLKRKNSSIHIVSRAMTCRTDGCTAGRS